MLYGIVAQLHADLIVAVDVTGIIGTSAENELEHITRFGIARVSAHHQCVVEGGITV